MIFILIAIAVVVGIVFALVIAHETFRSDK